MPTDATIDSVFLRRKQLLVAILLFIMLTLIISSCDSSGVCVGSGGDVLASPVCYENWDKNECQDYDDQEVNDAEWVFHGGDSCVDLGYSERCAENTFRLPGSC